MPTEVATPTSPPPPAQPASPTPTPHTSMAPYIGLIGLVAVVAVAGLLYYYLPRGPVATQETHFSLFEGGELSWYTLRPDGSVAQASDPAMTVGAVRMSAQQLKSGDTPIIRDVAGSPTGLGVVRSDGTVITLLDDGVPKYGIAARDDGAVVYTTYTDALTKNGTAVGDWQLMQTSVYDTPPLKTKALGKGFSTVFANNGALIAVAPEGLVYIDVTTGTRDTLIDRPGVMYGVASISPDATLAVLPNTATHALDVFSLSALNPRAVSYVASIPVAADAATFVGRTLVVKTATAFTAYTIDNGTVVTNSTYTYAP